MAACGRAALIFVVAAGLTASAGTRAHAQDSRPFQLFAGDSVRINGDVVGSVLSIDGTTLLVITRPPPKCRAGEGHGDAPICDPSPIIHHRLEMGEVVIERRVPKGHTNIRTAVGGVLGAAAFGTAGYFIGPHLGFGKIDSCLAGNKQIACDEPGLREQLEADQLRSDRRKGAFFFGLIGGSFVAVMARMHATGWVRIEPMLPAGSADGWGLSVMVPATR